MIRTRIGDIFESKAQTLVNTVNTVGVMGKGIALEFKKRFPDMFEDYVRRVREGKVRLGEPYLYTRAEPPWILNFPTKGHWRELSRLSDIVKGLEYLERHYEAWGIESLAVPPLGCGQGGLEWKVVGPTLYSYLKRFKIPVTLFAPHGTPREQLGMSFLASTDAVGRSGRAEQGLRVNPAWIALVEILARIERERHHWPIGRISFQKLAYFATEQGLPTGLEFEKKSFGPFAPGLREVESKLINNGLIIEENLGRMIRVRVGPTYQDAIRSYGAELAKWDEAIERVADLFLRMRRTRQAEVAATVHFAARHLAQPSSGQVTEADVFRAVKTWKVRRDPPFEDEEIGAAIRSLNMLDWLDARPSGELPVPEEIAVEP